jgi:MFS family permease
MEEIKPKRIAGVERNVFFLGLISLFNDFSAEMVQAVMPVFLTTVLGAPAFFVGLIEGVADTLSSVLKVISGWVSDKTKKRKLMAVSGYALSVGLRSFLAAVTTFPQVFALRIGDRLGKGLRDSPRDALIAESVDKSELGKSYGFHRAMDTLGATLGPLAAFILLPSLGYSNLFIFAFFLGLFALASFVFVKDREKHREEKPRPKLNWQLFKNNRRFAGIVAAIFVFGLGTLPIGLTLLKAKEVGPTITEVPLMYFIYGLAFVIFSIPLGRLADKIGTRFVIAMGFTLAALVYFAMANDTSVIGLAVLFVVLGIYSAATDGMERTLAAKLLPPEILATGQGFLNMAIGFSSLGAGIIGGLLWTTINSGAAFTYAGILSAAGLALFLYMTRKVKTA